MYIHTHIYIGTAETYPLLPYKWFFLAIEICVDIISVSKKISAHSGKSWPQPLLWRCSQDPARAQLQQLGRQPVHWFSQTWLGVS